MKGLWLKYYNFEEGTLLGWVWGMRVACHLWINVILWTWRIYVQSMRETDHSGPRTIVFKIAFTIINDMYNKGYIGYSANSILHICCFFT